MSMRKRSIKYTDEPMGKVKKVADFLPKPAELVLKKEAILLTQVNKKFVIPNIKK